MSGYEVRPVEGMPEIRAGDDLAALINEHAGSLADGDIVVVTSKIVSKSEGLQRATRDREHTIDDESVREVARRGPTRIVVTRHGLVMAAAGVDASNVDAGQVISLPHDPDETARAIRASLTAFLPASARIAVVITDTMGRPWRDGLVDMAIGAAGLVVLDDYRGQTDSYGNELEMTITAVADEVAAAAELAKGKLARVPVAVVRGLSHFVTDGDGPGAGSLVRPIEQDMFVLGAAEAARLGARAVLSWLAEGHGDHGDLDVTTAETIAADALAAYVLSASSRVMPPPSRSAAREGASRP